MVLLLEVSVAILGRTIKGVASNATPENIALVGGNTQALGRSLYTEYLLPFEIASRGPGGALLSDSASESAAGARSRSATRAGPTSCCRRACVEKAQFPIRQPSWKQVYRRAAR